jgi:imidazolonepropionase-like amidohydrolase
MVVALAASVLSAQAAETPTPRQVALRCGRLIDGKSQAVAENAVVLVEGDRIKQVGPGVAVPAGAEVVDLGRSTCLPGLIDNHTHILLQATSRPRTTTSSSSSSPSRTAPSRPPWPPAPRS